MDQEELRAFEGQRARLFALAYRMLGSASEAEDAVQETYLRWDGADRAEIRSAEAWLTTAVVNLCRTWLVSARARRESYVGPWLPEPVPTSELGPLDTVELRESVSLALLTAMERLNPLERAVFVLREAFGYPHRDIAQMLEVSEAASQQALHRATDRVRSGRTRFEVPATDIAHVLERFLHAARTGDIERLRAMLAAGVTATADGGGVVNAARRPVHGDERVTRYLLGLFRFAGPGKTFDIEQVNGAPAVVVRAEGAVLVVLDADVTESVISALRLHVNPSKLAYYARAVATR